MDCQMVQLYLGSRVDLLCVDRIKAIKVFIICFFHGLQHFGLFVFIGFFPFDRLVQFLAMVRHASHSGPSTPLQHAWQMACQSSSTGDGSHVLFSYICGADGKKHHSLFMRTQRELVRLFPNNSSRNFCRELWPHHFLGLCFFLQVAKSLLQHSCPLQ